jgi:hypothetical protein
MYFIQILFQTSSQYWNNVVQNAIGCAIGSIVAIGFSYLIYRWTIKQNNATIIEANKLRESNQLKALAVMLQDAIKMVKNQSKAIKKFIDELKKQPNEFPKITINPLGNLKRIIDTITIEGTGLTYMKHFSSKNSAKEFTSILELIDYLYAEFQGLEGLIQRASLNHHDRKIAVSKVFDYTNKLVLDYISRMPEIDIICQGIKQIKINFDNNRGSFDNIGSVNALFFVPLNNFIREMLNKGVKTDYSLELVYATSRGIEYFENIGSGYTKFENEMIGIETEVNINLPKLEAAASKILMSSFAST